MNNATIYFSQLDLTTWRAFCGRSTVATIKELTEDSIYHVTYRRTPGANPRNPAKTTRTVRGDLDHAQACITARGWV